MQGKFWLRLLLALAVLAALCAAQGSDDADPEDADAGGLATLTLRFDRQGSINVSLTLPAPDSPEAVSPQAIWTSLAQALHCPMGSLNSGAIAFDKEFSTYPKNWTRAQRDRYQKNLAQMEQRHLEGNCSSVLVRRDGIWRTDMDFSSFAGELQRAKVDELSLYIVFPETPFRDYPEQYLIKQPAGRTPFLMYQFPITASQLHNLHFAYGLRQSDVRRAFAITAAFIFIPILLTLWMRRSALASAKLDPAAAWYGFFRTLNWLLLASMLLWTTSSFGARNILQEWIASLGYSSWPAAAFDAMFAVIPAFLTYFVCLALSYPIHQQMRGSAVSRREFLITQMVAVGAQALPLMMALACLEMVHEKLELSVALLAVTLAFFQAMHFLKLRVMKSYPQPLSTGELRERIFALAGRLGVKLNQVFVLPAAKGQVANAYAAKGKIVMFTDHLLKHLSKREVDGVAAHELAHLEHKHPSKRSIAFTAALFLPVYYGAISGLISSLLTIPFSLLPSELRSVKLQLWFYTGVARFDAWPQRNFTLIMLGLMAFYFLSRHFENVADRTAVRLTGDPEAQITGLLRLSRLNFAPLQVGKFAEKWLTHPSTVRRAQRIAQAGGMSPERLREILVQYNAESIQRDAFMPPVAPEDHYVVPDPADAEKIKHAINRHAFARMKMWASFGLIVLSPAVFALVAERLRLEGYISMATYFAGLIITAALAVIASVRMARIGLGKERLRLQQRFERENVPAGRAEDIHIGFAPTPYPRIFGTFYHLDTGFLILARDRLQFVGEKTRFSLAASEIDGIALGPGGPSWWKFERTYIRWKDAANARNGVFNFYPLEPGSMWKAGAQVREIYARLEAWHKNSQSYPETRAEFATLQSPEISEAKGASPRLLGQAKIFLRGLIYQIALAVITSIVLHVNLGYVCQTVILVRIFQTIPYWRYRDRPPLMPHPPEPPKVRSAAAADSK